MRIVFAGTPGFAAAALLGLVDAGHEIALVLTQPDRPAGRGMKLAASEVKQFALRHRLSVFQPQTLKSPDAQERIRAAGAEAMVVAAYGLILPPAVLAMFRVGCINIHASLLPRWRGAAPIQRAILAGDDRTGISIMRMEEGLDTGPVYLQREIPITPQDTGGTVHDKLAALGARSIVDTLPQIAASRLAPLPQSRDGVSYAQKIAKDEAKVDWGREAFDVERRVRAFDPLPGAYSLLGGETVKIWKAHADARGGGDPGAILNADAAGLAVSCGRGTLTITQLQRSGGKRLSAADFLRGLVLAPGSRFVG